MDDEVVLIVYSAIFAAIVFTFTVIFALSIPATKGYWNIGEVGVYLASFIGGPIIGAIAGGLGSAMADIALGYAQYAPGTLIIKGLEGGIAGYLYLKLKEAVKNRTQRFYLLAIIIVMFLIILASYVIVFGGLGVNSIIIELVSEPLGWVLSLSIPVWVLILFILGMEVLAIIIIYLGKEELFMVFAALVAGTIMVFGYFLYETWLYGSSVALIEVIPNYFQVIVGIIVSVPVVQRLERLGVLDKYRKLMG